VRAAVDVMGGDHAPQAILQGCWDAAPLLSDEDVILLVGDKQVIDAGLSASGLSDQQKSRYRAVHTTQIIEMDDPPVEAIRNKPDSYCMSHDLETTGISAMVHDLLSLSMMYGVDPNARLARSATHYQPPKKAGPMRRAIDKLFFR